MKNCTKCGNELMDGSVICLKCNHIHKNKEQPNSIQEKKQEIDKINVVVNP